jgi:hypothetical protein
VCVRAHCVCTSMCTHASSHIHVRAEEVDNTDLLVKLCRWCLLETCHPLLNRLFNSSNHQVAHPPLQRRPTQVGHVRPPVRAAALCGAIDAHKWEVSATSQVHAAARARATFGASCFIDAWPCIALCHHPQSAKLCGHIRRGAFRCLAALVRQHMCNGCLAVADTAPVHALGCL